MTQRIAIQGIRGCNHHIAAIDFLSTRNLETVDCDTFRDLARVVSENDDVIGFMAIENTIAGSILQNYQLIRDFNLKVVGEYKLRIKHALVALPGVTMDDIVEVDSHPMALRQCEVYLQDNLKEAKVVEKDDTAGSAKWIAENGLRDHAAICPAGAASMYGMEVLADGIETNKRNFTRFLVVVNPKVEEKTLEALYKTTDFKQVVNKSSIVFTLPHNSGSLSKVLTVLSFYDMNLSLIQSLPILGREWEYQFYTNILFENYERYSQAINAIRPLTSELQILGEYPEGRQTI